MQENQPQLNNQNDFMKSIDSALKEAAPSNIMTPKLVDELMYYITPIIGFIAFVVILIYGVVPGIETTITKNQEVNDLQAEDTELKVRIANLEKIKSNIASLEEVIDTINSLVPEGQTEVVKFSQRIRESVNLNMGEFSGNPSEPEIKMNDIKIGELALVSVGNKDTGLKVNQIPTKFNFTGGLGRFRQMFTNLYEGSDFFVVEKMQLTYNNISQNWNGEVSLVKYQFNKEKDFDAEKVYGLVDENTQANKKVIDFLESRYLDSNSDTSNL